jgi:hypothetical protein
MTVADIIDFTKRTVSLDADPDTVLEDLKGTLQGFVLFGYDMDGNEVSAITFGHLPEALWAAQRGVKNIVERADVED